eukprot:PhM_4_TR14227/c1_g1_i3/m.66641
MLNKLTDKSIQPIRGHYYDVERKKYFRAAGLNPSVQQRNDFLDVETGNHVAGSSLVARKFYILLGKGKDEEEKDKKEENFKNYSNVSLGCDCARLFGIPLFSNSPLVAVHFTNPSTFVEVPFFASNSALICSVSMGRVCVPFMSSSSSPLNSAAAFVMIDAHSRQTITTTTTSLAMAHPCISVMCFNQTTDDVDNDDIVLVVESPKFVSSSQLAITIRNSSKCIITTTLLQRMNSNSFACSGQNHVSGNKTLLARLCNNNNNNNSCHRGCTLSICSFSTSTKVFSPYKTVVISPSALAASCSISKRARRGSSNNNNSHRHRAHISITAVCAISENNVLCGLSNGALCVCEFVEEEVSARISLLHLLFNHTDFRPVHSVPIVSIKTWRGDLFPDMFVTCSSDGVMNVIRLHKQQQQQQYYEIVQRVVESASSTSSTTSQAIDLDQGIGNKVALGAVLTQKVPYVVYSSRNGVFIQMIGGGNNVEQGRKRIFDEPCDCVSLFLCYETGDCTLSLLRSTAQKVFVSTLSNR